MGQRPYTIIAGIDRSESSELVLEHVIDAASRYRSAEIHVLGVVDTGHHLRRSGGEHDAELDQLDRSLRGQVEQALDDFDHPERRHTGWRIRVHARAGVPHEQILELAAEARADLILLGRHGVRGRTTRSMGSVPARVLEQARCPVLVLQTPDWDESASEAAEACPACVAVRRDSSGERWFCDEHSQDGYPWRTAYIMPSARMPLRDQGLWF